jgi:hypothetical protein
MTHFDASIKPDFMRLTHENKEAWKFVELFADRAHHLDDIIDGEAVITDEEMVQRELAWMLALGQNQFYKAHSGFLMPLIIMGCNAWLDANAWEKSDDPVKQTHSDVIKSLYHEVVFATVYICGGWNALREFTKKHREYQQDNYDGPIRT